MLGAKEVRREAYSGVRRATSDEGNNADGPLSPDPKATPAVGEKLCWHLIQGAITWLQRSRKRLRANFGLCFRSEMKLAYPLNWTARLKGAQK